MRRIAVTITFLLFSAALGATLALGQSPGPEGAEPGASVEDSQVSALGDLLRTHQRIAHFYLMGGDYETALSHFEAAAHLHVPTQTGDSARPLVQARLVTGQARALLMSAVALELMGQREAAVARAEVAQELIEALPDRAERRAERGDRAERRAERAERRAERGDRAERRAARAERRGQRGAQPGLRADRRDGERGGVRLGPAARRFGPASVAGDVSEFLADPAAFSERFAGGITALEERVMALEAELSDNGAR